MPRRWNLIPDLEGITERRLTHARRIGRRNYLSLRVLTQWIDTHGARINPDDLIVLERIAEMILDAGGYIIRQDLERLLIEEDLILPIDPVLFSINAKTDRSDPAVLAYDRMVAASHAADILVVNHALLCLNFTLRDRILGISGRPLDPDQEPGNPALLVIDEADQLRSAADALGSMRLNIPLLYGLLDLVPEEETARKAEEALGTLQTEADRLRYKDGLPLQPVNATSAAIDISKLATNLPERSRNRIKRMIRALKFLKGVLEERALFGHEGAVEACEDMERIIPALKAISRGKAPEAAIVLYCSPIRGQVGFAMQGIDPRMILSRIWRSDPNIRTILTSATLNMEKDHVPLKGFAVKVGIGEEDFLAASRACISPERFGFMSFMIADPRMVPLPVLRGEDEGGLPPLNPDHARLAIQMTLAAARKGGRVLVLVPSYRDCVLWKKIVTEDQAFAGFSSRFIFDSRRARSLSRERFKHEEGAILVSPSLWVGLDLPHLIKHLVIPRLPLQPADMVRDVLYEMFLRSTGNFTQKMIESRRFGVMLEEAVRKMRQGLGRPIRAFSDEVTVWITDPRWPVSLDHVSDTRRSWSGIFRRAVPDRFQEALDCAEIWTFAEQGEEDVDPAPQTLGSIYRRGRFRRRFTDGNRPMEPTD